MEIKKELLIGFMAAQMGFIDPVRVLQSANEWNKDSSQPFLDKLQTDSGLTDKQANSVSNAINNALESNNNDLQKTFESLGGAPELEATFNEKTETLSATLCYNSPELSDFKLPGQEDPSLTVSLEQNGHYSFCDSESKDRISKDDAEIGRGGIGRVLIAFDNHLGRDVAVKELLDVHDSDGSSMQAVNTIRFLREARVTGQLTHPNIVPVYEVGKRDDGSLYYTMKLVRGQTLTEALIECRSLKDRLKLLNHFVDLCQAIAYAHSRGVVHRDIKPQNVMVGQFGETVVLDWGIAKIQGKDDVTGEKLEEEIQLFQEDFSAKTLDGAILGTPTYMSPEQAAGKIDLIDERSDVWSLGTVLYEILTGQAPFYGKQHHQILNKVIESKLQPVRELCSDAPVELSAIAEKALQKERKLRYQTAKELADEVVSFQSGQKVQAYEYSLWELLGRFASKHKAPVMVALVALALLIATGLGAYSKVVKERDEARIQRDAAKKFANLLIYDLGKEMAPLPGWTPLREKLVESALEYYKANVDAERGSEADRLELAGAYLKLADVAVSLGRAAQAKESLALAMNIYTDLLSANPVNNNALRALCSVHNKMGNLAKSQGDSKTAKEHFNSSLKIASGLTSGPAPNRSARIMTLKNNLDLGDLAFSEGKGAVAGEHFLKVVETGNEMTATDSEDIEIQRSLSEGYLKLGDLAKIEGRSRQASENLERALFIRERIAKSHPEIVDHQRDLVEGYIKSGDLAHVEGRPDKTWEYFNKALSISRNLAELDPDNSDKQQELVACYYKIGKIAQTEGKMDQAHGYFTKAIQISNKLSAKDPDNIQISLELADGHSKVGDFFEKIGRHEKARESFNKAFELLNALTGKDPANVEIQVRLADCYGMFGDLYRAESNMPKAKEYYLQLLEIRRNIADTYPDNGNIQHALATAYSRFGYMELSWKNLPGARQHFEQALVIRKKLVEQNPENTLRQRALATTYSNLADSAKAIGENELAKEYYQRILGIDQKLAEAEPNNLNRLADLAFSYFMTGNIKGHYEIKKKLNEKVPENAMWAGDLFESAVLLEKYDEAIEMAENVLELNRDRIGSQAVILIYWAIAEAIDGNKQKAAECAKRAAAIALKMEVGPGWSFTMVINQLKKNDHPDRDVILEMMIAVEQWTLGGSVQKAAAAMQKFAERLER